MSAAPETAGKKPEHHRRPWRDNIEAVTMAIVMAVMLKYFIVEAYQIPTGSMQPTLMGNDEAGIKDRIIVDKLSLHFRDPERFEVVVFKYPLDRSKSFIKRICGMPGEDLKIQNGDLWTRKDPGESYKVLRRPPPVQREVWKRIHPGDPRYSAWKPDGAARAWTIQGRETVSARGDGSVRLPNDGGSVVDNYRDGYPGKMGDVLSRAGRFSASHSVGDLRIEGQAAALPGCKAVTIELREGDRRCSFVLPGPASAEGARPGIAVEGGQGSPRGDGAARKEAESPWRLPAGRSVAFAAQNMDDLLSLEVDGDVVAELEIPPASDQTSCFALQVAGEGADFTDLEVFRDIYYTEDGKKSEFSIPPGHYVMLGDNTQDSSDSRFWTFRTMGPDEDGRRVRGNWFPPQNPISIPGDPQGMRVYFRDEWGELHVFFSRNDDPPVFAEQPFVAREQIVGRAVAVFWPFSPNLNVWRLKWIH